MSTRLVIKKNENYIKFKHIQRDIKVIGAGRRGLTGSQGPQGPAGDDASGADAHYTQAFVSQTSVTVTHNLDKKPSVTIIDSAGDEVVGEVEYASTNELVVTFSSSFSGTIVLN